MKIELNNLSFTPRFSKKSLVSDISLEIEKGEFLTVMGPNGAGKTTLLKCLFGLLDYQGQIRYNDQEIKELSRRELAKRISYIPQITSQLPPFTVRDFVFMARYPYLDSVLDSGSEHYSLVEQAIEETNCASLSHRLIDSLSGGERQRVLLASALAQETDVILMDEPGSFLDPKHEALIYEVFEKLSKKNGKTLIVVSHDFNRTALFSNRIIALKNSMLAFDGPAKEFINSELLSDIYETEFTLVRHPKTGANLALPNVQ